MAVIGTAPAGEPATGAGVRTGGAVRLLPALVGRPAIARLSGDGITAGGLAADLVDDTAICWS